MSARTKYLILVVDDDVDLLATVKDFLEFEGFAIETAPNGEAGLQKMEAVNPDLIILDMNMPGMGGIPFLKEMAQKKDFADIPVFVFTARANLEEFFSDTKVAGFMSKPCDPDDLLLKVKGILASKPTRGSAQAPQSGAPKGGPASAPAVDPGNRLKILLAEDEAGRSAAISSGFETLGWKVVIVDSGSAVVAKAVSERPDAIVMRVVLKDMNGDAVSAELGKISAVRDIPILLYEDSGVIPRDRSDGGKPRKIRFLNSSRHEKLSDVVRSLVAVK